MIKKIRAWSNTALVGRTIFPFLEIALLFGTAATFASAAPETGQVASTPAEPAQQVFATPKLAADALVQASESYNLSTLERILGPESEALLSSEDPFGIRKLPLNLARRQDKKPKGM